jgi:tetratricopeptide (TPR) repeat protein
MKHNFSIFFVLLIWTNSFSQTTSDLIKKGDNYFRVKKYSKAIRAYSKAIANDNANVEAYFKRAQSYSLTKNDEAAVKDYDRAIRFDPKNPKIYFMRAQSNLYIGFIKFALDDYKQAIDLDTNYIAAYAKLGDLFFKMRKTDEAIEFFTKAIVKDPNQSADVYNNRGYCYLTLKSYKQALDDYATAIIIKPDYLEAYLNSGYSYLKLKEYDKAIDFYDKASNFDSKDSEIYYARGFAYFKIGKTEKACTEWTKSVKLGNKNAQTYIDKHCR